jgi:hypothetical protein
LFESITIRGGQSHQDTYIDPGTFAESLLFYQNVHLVLDRGNLVRLVKAIGIDNLRLLLDSGACSATYFCDMTGVHGQALGGSTVTEYEFVSFELAGADQKPRQLRDKEHFLDPFTRDTSVSIPTGKLDRLFERISAKKTADLSLELVNPLDAALSDLDDNQYVWSTVTSLLKLFVPEYQATSSDYFRARRTRDSKFVIDTSLNFDQINNYYHRRVPAEHSILTPAYFISHLLTTRWNFALALKYSTDLVTSDVSSTLLELRVRGILEKRNVNAAKLSRFENVVLQKTKSVREAINSGELSFDNFMKLLEEANRFKVWLKGKPMDADLVDSYYQEISKKGWIDTLPNRVTRFALFTLVGLGTGELTAGLSNVAAGIGLGVFDTFIFDKIAKGWKPNQFVEGSIEKYLKSG